MPSDLLLLFVDHIQTIMKDRKRTIALGVNIARGLDTQRRPTGKSNENQQIGSLVHDFLKIVEEILLPPKVSIPPTSTPLPKSRWKPYRRCFKQQFKTP